jgi:tetratricopeptide (TPR) repeat protein
MTPDEKSMRVLQVVAVSPGDVTAERDVLKEVVDELNREVAPSRGYRLSLWRWETDAGSGLHLAGPQGLIDDMMKIQDADIVIGIIWKRFGTPTAEAESGTEHELRRAWAAWKQHGRPDVMVYFCDREHTPRTAAELEQWRRVLDFQKRMPGEQFPWRYVDVADFERKVREHLTRKLPDIKAPPEPIPSPPNPTDSLSERAAGQQLSESALKRFRADVREDAQIGDPSLTPHEMLGRLGLLQDGGPTRAAVLLFGTKPQRELPGASVQCVHYLGADRTAHRQSSAWIDEDIRKQIEDAFVFIRDRVPRREYPIAGSARSQVDYAYPMTCVREVVVNAVVHRDYTDMGRNVHVRVYSDRIEVLSPGAWCSRAAIDGEVALRELESQSVKRNPLIARTMSLIRFFEGEGSGIPTAVRDAESIGAPEPTARFEDGFVVVTIFPRVERGRVRFNLPQLAASFSGREEELDVLDQALASTDRAVITQAITGLGGVGKSQLAAGYVHRHGNEYDVMAWIRAEDGGVEDLAQLAAKLGEPVDGLSPGERAQLALDWLSNSTQRWLLVLDNVASAEQLAQWRLRPGSGRVLVTSRDRALRQFGPVLAVDVFDEDSATAYLTDRAGRPGDEQAARQLARALGFLPLALSHAAAYCESGGTSFADYLALLDELPANELFDSHPELSYAQTVASTWKTSFQAAVQQAPLAADVLEMAAHLGSEAIPKSLFEVLVDVDAALGRKRLGDAINALARFSLATVDNATISVHRLLQKTVRDDASARSDHTTALRALAGVDDAFPDDVSLPAGWPLCEQLLPHALALADALSQPGDAGPRLIDLLNRACYYLIVAEPAGRGLAIASTALRHAERVLGVEHPHTLTIRNHQATAYRQAGRIGEAIASFEALIADRQQILGAAHPDTLITRNDLAYTYLGVGRSAEAIAIFETLLGDRERILGAEHPGTLTTRHNLALAYRLAGRSAEAIAIFEPLLADTERILGAEHHRTLITRNNLEDAYQAVGRSGEAITVFEALLADHERIIGAEHPDTLITRNNLALAYQAVGRSGDATAILEALLADRERILGAEHPDTLTTRQHLASAYLAAGGTDAAIGLLEQVLADYKRLLGVEHPDTVTARHELIATYRAAGRHDDADRA